MEKVTVYKKELLGIIEHNKERHDAIFDEAVKGFWDKSIEALEDKIDECLEHKANGVYVSLPFPTSYSHEYERAIKMLSMSVEETIVLTKGEFSQFVMNEWGWRAGFIQHCSGYIGSTFLGTGFSGF